MLLEPPVERLVEVGLGELQGLDPEAEPLEVVLVLRPGQAIDPAGALLGQASTAEELAEDVVLEQQVRGGKLTCR